MPYSRELFEKRSTTAIITRHAASCVTPQLPVNLRECTSATLVKFLPKSRANCVSSGWLWLWLIAQRVVPVCRPARRALRMYLHCTVHVPQLAGAPRVLRMDALCLDYSFAIQPENPTST